MRKLKNYPVEKIILNDIKIAFRKMGSGPPLLLLHGYPQNMFMWHLVAGELSDHFTLVLADLRGYGDSDKPKSDETHSLYSKKNMAKDMHLLMEQLGYNYYSVIGHDRGGRVAHRMARDYHDNIEKISVLDIAPTISMYKKTNFEFAKAYYHWFFLIQPHPLPEQLISKDPEFYLRHKMNSWGRKEDFHSIEAMKEYIRCFCNSDAIHSTCEDYRASSTIDLTHDEEDKTKLQMPLQAIWGKEGFVGKNYNVISEWRKVAQNVNGAEVPGGHYVVEESPMEFLKIILPFLKN